MPADSEKQRRAMGAALAVKRGKVKPKPKSPSAEMAENMSENQISDFATKGDIPLKKAWRVLKFTPDNPALPPPYDTEMPAMPNMYIPENSPVQSWHQRRARSDIQSHIAQVDAEIKQLMIKKEALLAQLEAV